MENQNSQTVIPGILLTVLQIFLRDLRETDVTMKIFIGINKFV